MPAVRPGTLQADPRDFGAVGEGAEEVAEKGALVRNLEGGHMLGFKFWPDKHVINRFG